MGNSSKTDKHFTVKRILFFFVLNKDPYDFCPFLFPTQGWNQAAGEKKWLQNRLECQLILLLF